MSIRPSVECGTNHTRFSVPDIRAAVAYYTTTLGFTEGFLWGEPEPSYAGVNLGNAQLFLSQGEPNPSGVEAIFLIGNADELFEYQAANGVKVLTPPGDRDYGIRDYSVSDPWGYQLTFGHYIYSVGPAVEIERVDVPVRLEKRLAAVLRDLADFKRKHRLDYDCHASYRFRERTSAPPISFMTCCHAVILPRPARANAVANRFRCMALSRCSSVAPRAERESRRTRRSRASGWTRSSPFRTRSRSGRWRDCLLMASNRSSCPMLSPGRRATK